MERMIFQQAITNAPISVVITDTNNNIEYVNPFFTKLTGYELYEVLGKNPRILQSGKTPAGTYDDLWTAMKEGKTWSGYFYNKREYRFMGHHLYHIKTTVDSVLRPSAKTGNSQRPARKAVADGLDKFSKNAIHPRLCAGLHIRVIKGK
jgi:PAS domain S-box-containing protein